MKSNPRLHAATTKMLRLLCWQAVLLLGANAFADVVILKDGRQITGIVELGFSSQIRLRTGDKSEMISIDRIQSIQFDPLEGAPPQTVGPQRAGPQATGFQGRETQESASPAPSASAQGITLPIGTEIAVRTIEPINSKQADLYKEYSASLDDPVVVDGVTLVPANARAVLRVSQVQSSGVTRRASISLVLVAVTVNGRRVEVKTGPVDSKSGSQAKRTAEGAGIGAASGAAVGAMAGGAIGAGIGAGVGAAAGTAVAVIKGKPVEIRSETRFTYKLAEPAVINSRESSR